MKQVAAIMMALFAVIGLQAQGDKKVQTFQVTRVIELPAEAVWNIVGKDYGAIAYSHPKIIKSEYINGTLKAEEGAERVCYFNEKETQFVKEKITSYNAEGMSFTNIVYQAGKFPVDPDYTEAIYSVKPLANGKCEVSFDMQYRTKPGFMGSMTKGKFRKLISDYLICVEHKARTGESVTKENFKEVKKLYV